MASSPSDSHRSIRGAASWRERESEACSSASMSVLIRATSRCLSDIILICSGGYARGILCRLLSRFSSLTSFFTKQRDGIRWNGCKLLPPFIQKRTGDGCQLDGRRVTQRVRDTGNDHQASAGAQTGDVLTPTLMGNGIVLATNDQDRRLDARRLILNPICQLGTKRRPHATEAAFFGIGVRYTI